VPKRGFLVISEMEIERQAIPAVEAWYRRLADRSPHREHVMIPFEDL